MGMFLMNSENALLRDDSHTDEPRRTTSCDLDIEQHNRRRSATKLGNFLTAERQIAPGDRWLTLLMLLALRLAACARGTKCFLFPRPNRKDDERMSSPSPPRASDIP